MMIIIMIMIINNKNKVIKLKPKNNSSDVLRYKKKLYTIELVTKLTTRLNTSTHLVMCKKRIINKSSAYNKQG